MAFPELSRDVGKGWILEGPDRIISFKVKTFQRFIDSLVGMAGAHVADVLLYHMGSELGHTAHDYTKEETRSEDDLPKVIDRVLTERGWGRCLEMTVKRQNGRVAYVFTVSGGPLVRERRAAEPTCTLVRGSLAGWLEAYLGKKAQSSTETECASTGDKFCIFEVTF